MRLRFKRATTLRALAPGASRRSAGRVSVRRSAALPPAGSTSAVTRRWLASARVSVWVAVTFWGVIAAASVGHAQARPARRARAAVARRTMVQAPANANEAGDTPVRGPKKPAQTDFYNTFL